LHIFTHCSADIRNRQNGGGQATRATTYGRCGDETLPHHINVARSADPLWSASPFTRHPLCNLLPHGLPIAGDEPPRYDLLFMQKTPFPESFTRKGVCNLLIPPLAKEDLSI